MATVDKVRVGSAKDFIDFELTKAVRRSSIYYVDVALRNVGGQRLGGAAVPLYAVASSGGGAVPPGNLVGEFKPCNGGGVLPAKFEPNDRTRTCLLYLLPPGASLSTVQLVTGLDDTVAWTVPAGVADPQGKSGAGERADGKDGGRRN